MGGAWRDIWASFKFVVAGTASAIAFALALLGSIWDPGITVQIRVIWLAAFGFLTASVVATAVTMAIAARRAVRPPPPRIVHVLTKTATEATEPPVTILVIERSDLFSVNALVTICLEEALPYRGQETVEEAIGIGRVLNIQENGLVQVRILREDDGHALLWQRIRARETAVLPHVMIEPPVDFNAVGIGVAVR